MNGSGDILQLAARVWVERRGALPDDEGALVIELEDASPLLRNPVVDALQRFGFPALQRAVAQVLVEVRT